jgi:hypothetical protein
VPDNLPDDPHEVYRMAFRRGHSQGHKEGLDDAWKRR